jgi:hypothetical protein
MSDQWATSRCLPCLGHGRSRTTVESSLMHGTFAGLERLVRWNTRLGILHNAQFSKKVATVFCRSPLDFSRRSCLICSCAARSESCLLCFRSDVRICRASLWYSSDDVNLRTPSSRSRATLRSLMKFESSRLQQRG